MVSPASLAEMLGGGRLDIRVGRDHAFVALAHSICSRWLVPNDVTIALVRDARDWVFPLLGELDPIMAPKLPAPRSRWQRLVRWVKKLFGKPVIDPVAAPPIHEETVQLEAWGVRAAGFYYRTRIGYGPESNVLAWTGMKSEMLYGERAGAIVATSPGTPSS